MVLLEVWLIGTLVGLLPGRQLIVYLLCCKKKKNVLNASNRNGNTCGKLGHYLGVIAVKSFYDTLTASIRQRQMHYYCFVVVVIVVEQSRRAAPETVSRSDFPKVKFDALTN